MTELHVSLHSLIGIVVQPQPNELLWLLMRDYFEYAQSAGSNIGPSLIS